MQSKDHILLIEDDDIDTMTVRRAMRDLDVPYQLSCVTNGEEGLDFLRNPLNPRPGLILLDINMPRMNGIEFLTEMKADPALKSIPVNILTTSKEELDRLAAFDNSVAGYMVKPVDYPQFVKIMSAIYNYWAISEKDAIREKIK